MAKCNIMRATHARQKKVPFEYELDGLLLKDTDSTKYLGVELLADMKLPCEQGYSQRKQNAVHPPQKPEKLL